MLHSAAGWINSIMVLVSLLGVFLQLKQIWKRKKLKFNPTTIQSTNETATELLSLNQFSVSFFAYLSFFIYGYSVSPFTHFLVWPRLLACLIILMILWELFWDRRRRPEKLMAIFTTLLFGFGLLGLIACGLELHYGIADGGRLISTTIILVVSILLAQGYWHQISLILRSGRTGAINVQMSQYILAMDLSTLFLAYTMGFWNSWPLVVLAVVSGITKVIILYLFRWVRLSKTAATRRVLV